MKKVYLANNYVVDDPVLHGTYIELSIKTEEGQVLVCVVEGPELMSTIHELRVSRMSKLDIKGTLLHDIKGLDRPTLMVTKLERSPVSPSLAASRLENSDDTFVNKLDYDNESYVDNNDGENRKRSYNRRSLSPPPGESANYPERADMEDDTDEEEEEEERKEMNGEEYEKERQSKRFRTDAMEMTEDDGLEMVPSARSNNCPGNLFYNLYGRLHVLNSHAPDHLQPQLALLYDLLTCMANMEEGISSHTRLFIEKMSEFHSRLKDCYRECPDAPYPLDTNEVELPHWIYEFLPKKKRLQQR
ncbi:hypothetical protein BDB00DRAFT_925464 [Zychaea mexicana]|uniref:uncharacterized protein n=1 Tax=Zychaea mexicana TaxID=64656 RepID=UPI0022FDD523|nr:uncharacterized protein BDB00DRAFT_925464 [Zychaea mexicana]KAI9498244.1 hypothetical protein BDB00DRAFT_925464 [Zychaea mexicana]